MTIIKAKYIQIYPERWQIINIFYTKHTQQQVRVQQIGKIRRDTPFLFSVEKNFLVIDR